MQGRHGGLMQGQRMPANAIAACVSALREWTSRAAWAGEATASKGLRPPSNTHMHAH